MLLSLGNGWLTSANYARVGNEWLNRASASFRCEGDKCVRGEVRLEVLKGCLQAENVAAVAHTPCLRFLFVFLSGTLLGSFVPPVSAICAHIFIGFLTPVDKRHPLLSAAATQTLVDLIRRRGENIL